MKGHITMGGTMIDISPVELKDLIREQGLMPSDIFSRDELLGWARADKFAADVKAGLIKDEEAKEAETPAAAKDKQPATPAADHKDDKDKYLDPSKNPLIRLDPD